MQTHIPLAISVADQVQFTFYNKWGKTIILEIDFNIFMATDLSVIYLPALNVALWFHYIWLVYI